MPELQEPVVAVAEGAEFALLSFGDGASYALRSKEDQASAYFEGEAGAAFLAEYESAKAQYPAYTADQVLAQLWDQGGYSWMAVPDGE